MENNKITKELIESLEKLVEFYDQNDDGTGEPFMALGFPYATVEAFQRAKKTLAKAKKEID